MGAMEPRPYQPESRSAGQQDALLIHHSHYGIMDYGIMDYGIMDYGIMEPRDRYNARMSRKIQ